MTVFEVSYEVYKKLRELSYLVVMEVEFNHDKQTYEVALRDAGWRDT